MTDAAETVPFIAAFERAAGAIPADPEFAGIEVVLTTVRPGRTVALTVMLDREGGLDIGSCERIAAHVNAALDGYPDMYTLEVSSAGLDRPLVKPADYDRFAGRAVKVVTTVAIGNAKTHRGMLEGRRGDEIVLHLGASPGIELRLPLAAIRSANVEYDIRADLQRAKRDKRGG